MLCAHLEVTFHQKGQIPAEGEVRQHDRLVESLVPGNTCIRSNMGNRMFAIAINDGAIKKGTSCNPTTCMARSVALAASSTDTYRLSSAQHTFRVRARRGKRVLTHPDRCGSRRPRKWTAAAHGPQIETQPARHMPSYDRRCWRSSARTGMREARFILCSIHSTKASCSPCLLAARTQQGRLLADSCRRLFRAPSFCMSRSFLAFWTTHVHVSANETLDQANKHLLEIIHRQHAFQRLSVCGEKSTSQKLTQTTRRI